MAGKLLRFLNGALTFVVVLALVVSGTYAGYSLWDNQQVYDATENVVAELREIRADMDANDGPTGLTLSQLIADYEAKTAAEAAEKEAASIAEKAESTNVQTETDEAQEQAEETHQEVNEPDMTETVSADEERTEAQNTAAAAETESTAVMADITRAELTVEADAALSDAAVKAAAQTEGQDLSALPEEKAGAVPEFEPAEAEIKISTEETPKAATETTAPMDWDSAALTDASASEETAAPTEARTEAPIETPTAAPTEEPTATPAPTATPEPAELTPFQKLQQINPDITAGLTLPNTGIDDPVLQGSSNYSYINTDVYGNFALAGSIFLDSRNAREYQDNYSLVYGHDMSQHRMFSDINLYKDEEFFQNNRLGMLMLPDGVHLIESLAVIVAPANDSGLFNPENWTRYTGEEMLEAVQENNLYSNERGLEALKAKVEKGEAPKIIALSTCSDEYTDARTILLTLMDP